MPQVYSQFKVFYDPHARVTRQQFVPDLRRIEGDDLHLQLVQLDQGPGSDHEIKRCPSGYKMFRKNFESKKNIRAKRFVTLHFVFYECGNIS